MAPLTRQCTNIPRRRGKGRGEEKLGKVGGGDMDRVERCEKTLGSDADREGCVAKENEIMSVNRGFLKSIHHECHMQRNSKSLY